jgi:hypothetical protein
MQDVGDVPRAGGARARLLSLQAGGGGRRGRRQVRHHHTVHPGEYSLYTVKKVIDFPVLNRDVTNQTLPGGE